MNIVLVFVFIIAIVILISYVANQNTKEKVSKISGELRVKYPNFVKSLRSIPTDEMELNIDDNRVLSYKFPIKTFGAEKGIHYISLFDDETGNRASIIQVYKGWDGTELHTRKIFLNDPENLTIDDFSNLLQDQVKEIFMNEKYLQSVSVMR